MSVTVIANVPEGSLPHENVGRDVVSPELYADAGTVANYICERDLREISSGVVANVTGTTLFTFMAAAGMEYDVNESAGEISAEALHTAFRGFYAGDLVFSEHELRLAGALFGNALALNFGVTYS